MERPSCSSRKGLRPGKQQVRPMRERNMKHLTFSIIPILATAYANVASATPEGDGGIGSGRRVGDAMTEGRKN